MYKPAISQDELIAISYHSDKKKTLKLKDLGNYPVLVITHRAYVLALDRLNNNSTIEETWSYFHDFYRGQRSLVVIDEAIDLVEESSLSLNHVRMLLGFIPQEIRVQYPNEILFLKTLEGILEKLETDKELDTTKERVIVVDPLIKRYPTYSGVGEAIRDGTLQQAVPEERLTDHEVNLLQNAEGEIRLMDFAALKESLKHVRFDRQIDKDDADESERLSTLHRNTLSSVDALYQSWFYYSKDNSKPTFNTARLLVPKNARGAVILDATAGCNVMYELFENAQVIEPPQGTRDYQNVTLHVSVGHKVGKIFMGDNPQGLSDALMGSLAVEFEKYDTKRKVLIVTHKKLEPHLLQYEPEEFEVSVAHWGALNGSNKWKDCDTVVIFGLPYRPNTFPVNAFMAFQGVQTTEWLTSQEERKFRDYNDIREAIATGQMVTDIVQAINRVRCRKVIDTQGNCPPTDVYLLLPTKETAQDLLTGITKQMPNVRVVNWNYKGQKQKKRGVKKSNYEESLVSYLLTNLSEGSKIVKSTVKDTLGIPKTTFERLISRLHTPDPSDPMVKQLADSGISYQVKRRKKTQRGYFLKQ